jgi:ATP-dependent DNA ligase
MQAVLESHAKVGQGMNLLDWAMRPIATHKDEVTYTKWYAQPKLDGHRMCVIGGPKLVLTISKRGQQNVAEKPPGWNSKLAPGTTLDGELVSGYFYAFDILAHNNQDVTGHTHRGRMAILKKAIPKEDYYAQVKVYQDVPALWDAVQTTNAEGIVLKDPKSVYRPGASSAWRKVKNTKIVLALVKETSPNKAGVTAVLVDPRTDQNLGKVHTLRYVVPGDIVRVRYCQVYSNGILREAVILPS